MPMCPRSETAPATTLMALTTTPEPSSVVKTCPDKDQVDDRDAASSSGTSNVQQQPNAVASSSRVKVEDVLSASSEGKPANLQSEVALGKRRCDFTQDEYAQQADRV